MERNALDTHVRGPTENEAELLTLDEASARVGDIPLFADQQDHAEVISGLAFVSLRTAIFLLPACLENLAFRAARCLPHGNQRRESEIPLSPTPACRMTSLSIGVLSAESRYYSALKYISPQGTLLKDL
jgi:hypothetical protein